MKRPVQKRSDVLLRDCVDLLMETKSGTTQLIKEVKDLKAKLESIRTRVNATNASFAVGVREYVVLNSTAGATEGVGSQVQHLLSPQEEGVRFSVGMNYHLSTSSGIIVKYNLIFNNHTDARHYNMKTGKFVAPVGGNYIFHYHALTQANKAMSLELNHNSNVINSAYGYAKPYAGSGNTAILYLRAGDEVYVRLRNGAIYGDSDEFYCTFSGYLI